MSASRNPEAAVDEVTLPVRSADEAALVANAEHFGWWVSRRVAHPRRADRVTVTLRRARPAEAIALDRLQRESERELARIAALRSGRPARLPDAAVISLVNLSLVAVGIASVVAGLIPVAALCGIAVLAICIVPDQLAEALGRGRAARRVRRASSAAERVAELQQAATQLLAAPVLAA
jgi:hypothetical protein